MTGWKRIDCFVRKFKLFFCLNFFLSSSVSMFAHFVPLRLQFCKMILSNELYTCVISSILNCDYIGKTFELQPFIMFNSRYDQIESNQNRVRENSNRKKKNLLVDWKLAKMEKCEEKRKTFEQSACDRNKNYEFLQWHNAS